MAGHGWPWIEMSGLAASDWKWLEITGNSWKCLEMVGKGGKWQETGTGTGGNWL